MLDLHTYLVLPITLNCPISMGFLVDDVDMDGRALFLQVFLLEEESEQGRADRDSIVCGVDYQVKLFFRDHFVVSPAIP